MRKLSALFLTLVLIFSLCSCNSTQLSNESNRQTLLESDLPITVPSKPTETTQSTSDITDKELKANGTCEHNWERDENLGKYIATEKCSLCENARKFVDPNSFSSTADKSSILFSLYTLSYSAHGLVADKEITPCDMTYAIIDCISGLQETGEVAPKVSDEVLTLESKDLPIESGTL